MTRSIEEIKNLVEDLGYIYIDSYSGNKYNRKVIIQDEYEYKYDIFLGDILRGRKISFVDKGNPFSLDNITLWLKLNNSQFRLLENSEYISNNSKLNLYCSKCEDFLKTSWTSIYQGQGCGVCDGKQVGKNHNLAIQRPHIAKEWHPTLNGNLTPYDVTHGSEKKVWWICSMGHEYYSSIINKTRSGRGCRLCADESQESKIANELKKYILNKYESKDEYLALKNPKSNRYLPFDIYIFSRKNPKINGIYIEVHGEQHYKISGWNKRKSIIKQTSSEEEFEYQKYKDKIKKSFAKKHGIYIEVDLRKIKTTEEAIEYIENILEQTLSKLG